MSRGRVAGDRPDGLPPALGTHRPSRAEGRSVAVVVVLALGVPAAVAAARGERAWAVGLAVVGAVLAGLALVEHRTALTVGPGWLQVRSVAGSRLVRTDRLRAVVLRRTSVFSEVLRLVDDEGRRATFSLHLVTADPRLFARLVEDVAASVRAGARVNRNAEQRLHVGRARDRVPGLPEHRPARPSRRGR